ncbi:MAG: S9 family peptidase, partial [Saprospiraceae bacterium]|nr:S9 family peptidase [Saprospiraceae bacterium]
LDTVQLGEIEGIHHGLYRYDRWWWMSRGYTPAGVEAWNGIRAIDYLIERPEVDADRIGVTGRSGGGATTWWIAALDHRVKAAVPVAGITNMNDHVVEGCVEGHCDCMYIVNYHQWDYAKVAALLAPRQLLISNTDRDPIFPIDGVFDVFQSVREVYQQLDAREALALHTTAGPHQDVQELRVHAFRWFNQHLQGHDDLIEKPAVKFFDPEELRVFDHLPTDAVNARIDESFVPRAPSVFEQLESASLPDLEGRYQEILRSQIFGFWPWEEEPMMEEVESSERDNTEVTLYELKTDEHTKLPIFHIENSGQSADQKSQIIVLDDTNWSAWAEYLDAFFPEHSLWKDLGLDQSQQDEVQELIDANGSIYLISARGLGPAQFQGNDNKLIHIKRRFYLLGQSSDAMQTWDLKQALEVITAVREDETVRASAHRVEAGKLLYASLFTTDRLQLFLSDLPPSHNQGPYYLGIMRHMDMPASVLMAAGKHDITITSSSTSDSEHWKSLKSVADRYPDLSLNVADN